MPDNYDFNSAIKPRCKPGDLALVVNSSAENVGKVVKVISAFGVAPCRLKSGSFYGVRQRGSYIWNVESLSSPVKQVFYRTGRTFVAEQILPDCILQPLPKVEEDIQEEVKETLKEPV